MKELASNGVVQMKETLIENSVEKSAHLVETTAENVVENVAEKASDATEVIDNQSPTSDFQIRANQLINEGLDRPTSLESLIAGMREDKNYTSKTEISEDLSRQVDAILEVENPTVGATSFGGFTLEQILKDEDLRELMNKAETDKEILATEPVQNGIHSDTIVESKSSNGNGHPVVLTDDDTDLVKKIAAEAELDFEEKMRLKLASEMPPKVDNTPIAIVSTFAETPVETTEPTAIAVEHFTEKTDAELRDLMMDTDEETVKSEVSRIFDEAEEPAAHFEFEEDINDKLDETTAALFEEKTDAETLELIDNQLDSVEAKNTEGPKIEAEVVQELRDEPMNMPTDNAARYQLAAELAQQSRLTEATEQLEILLETDRKNVEAYVLLAYLAEQQGDYTLSLNSLEKVALLNPDYPGIYYKLGQLTKEHFKKQGRKALRYFQDAVAQDPSNADAQYRLAMLLIEQKGDHATAIEHLTRAVESAPQHDAAAFELAKSYVETGDQKSAATFYARASELNSSFKSAANDVLFHYEVLQPEPIVATELEPVVNDNGMTVMITGATSGIGRATAEVFAKNGYRLILTGRRNDRLEDIKTTFETTYNNRIQILNFDVRSLEGIKNAVNTLEEDFKHVDILINNAGLASGLSPIHEGDVSDWEVMIDTNIKGLLYITRAIAPSMVARKKGHIINLSSIAGKEIYPNGNVYIATKHAVDALTKAMRVDLHKYGIRVSQVAPGAVEETEFALVRFHGDAEKAKIYDEFTPLKASDVAESIYFIASRADYVNIQDIVLAGTQQAMAAFVDRSGRTDK